MFNHGVRMYETVPPPGSDDICWMLVSFDQLRLGSTDRQKLETFIRARIFSGTIADGSVEELQEALIQAVPHCGLEIKRMLGPGLAAAVQPTWLHGTVVPMFLVIEQEEDYVDPRPGPDDPYLYCAKEPWVPADEAGSEESVIEEAGSLAVPGPHRESESSSPQIHPSSASPSSSSSVPIYPTLFSAPTWPVETSPAVSAVDDGAMPMAINLLQPDDLPD